MKFRNNIAGLGLAALAVAALGLASAQAALVATPVNNDIFLGVHATGGVGSSFSYLVNLGQYSQFANQTPGTTVTLSGLGDIGADLVATYGANWNTRPNVFWGIFGRSTAGQITLYASKEQEIVGTTGTPWQSLSSTQRGSTSSQVGTPIFGTNGFDGRESTANSPFAVVQDNAAAGTAAYAFQVTNGVSDFGTTSGWENIEGDFGSGTAGTALDLFRIDSTGVTTPGFFTINDSGSLSFTAVPEPSAALLGAVGAFLLLSNRRRQHATR